MSEPSDKPTDDASTEEAITATPDDAAQSDGAPQEEAPEDDSSLKKHPIAMIVLAVAVVAIVLAVGLMWGGRDNTTSSASAPSQTSEEGGASLSAASTAADTDEPEETLHEELAPIVWEDDPADMEESEPGFPVTHELTKIRCGSCHASDEDGNLSRISWTRATPEGWSQTVKRMVSLHGMQLDPEDARAIVKYLSDSHGLAPEEAKPVMYIPERRTIDETIIPDPIVRQACASCHAFGQPMSSRRTKTEWRLLQNMHAALYSTAQRQLAQTLGDDAEGESDPNAEPKTYGDVALEYLEDAAKLHTAEWSSWQARMGPPRLAGKWLVNASLQGYGDFVGEMVIEAGDAPDKFATSITLKSLETGEELSRKGEGLVYTGYSWRGRSSGGKALGGQPSSPPGDIRETMWFAPDRQSAEGRWYWGDYHEFGFDVSLTRATGAPIISAVSPKNLQAGQSGVRLELMGDNLATELATADVDLGPGVVVNQIVSASPSRLVVEVDVDENAPKGLHNVSVASAFLEKGLPVYDEVSYLKVTPETGLSFLGGVVYGKGFQQFEALGYSNGADGKPDTDDDFLIGEIDADWSLQEFPTVAHDNDIQFVGDLSNSGLFTPAVEGPNPQRRFGRNNYGEVWVVAKSKEAESQNDKPLSARAYLVVTVPQYRRWDQPGVSP